MPIPAKPLKFVIALTAVLAAVVVFSQRVRIRDLIADIGTEPVPSAVPYASTTDIPTDTPTPSSSDAPTLTPTAKPSPATVNLAIPFVPQAPFKIWDHDHEEFCEEAAALMAASYVKGDRSVTDPAVAEAELQKIKAYELKTFGYFEDTTAVETTRILTDYFKLTKVEVVKNPTITDIKSWVAAGRAVLVPTAGRMLGNPNFTGIGPLYHFLVIKGYTANGTIITNDAGTRKGADYQYAPSVIMNAMHDWNGGDVNNGAKVVILVG